MYQAEKIKWYIQSAHCTRCTNLPVAALAPPTSLGVIVPMIVVIPICINAFVTFISVLEAAIITAHISSDSSFTSLAV